MTQAKDATICIFRAGDLKAADMETFIRAHVEHIPARVKVVYGGRELYDGKTGEAIGNSLEPFLMKHRIDAVLAEYGISGVRVMEGCKAANVPLLVHFLGFDGYRRDVIDRFRSLYLRLFKLAAAIIYPSPSMSGQLIRLGAPREKLFYCPCGADLSFFSGARPESAPPLLVAVGRFVEKKAPQLTIMAFRRLMEQAPEARLEMIGCGPMLDACRELAKTLKISDRIDFLGPRSQSEIADAFIRARAFVQHSLQAPDGDSEAGPVAIKEAGAAGLPVVSTYHDGIPDIVSNGETGYLVPERDIDGMAWYMMKLIKDPDLAGKMGKAATQRIAAHFSMDKCINNLWQVIRLAIS